MIIVRQCRDVFSSSFSFGENNECWLVKGDVFAQNRAFFQSRIRGSTDVTIPASINVKVVTQTASHGSVFGLQRSHSEPWRAREVVLPPDLL